MVDLGTTLPLLRILQDNSNRSYPVDDFYKGNNYENMPMKHTEIFKVVKKMKIFSRNFLGGIIHKILIN